MDAQTLTGLINLLVALLGFGVLLGGGLWKVRKWQRADMTGVVRHELEPLKEENAQLLAEQEGIRKSIDELTSKIDKIEARGAGHESRISFLEGVNAARAEFRSPPPVELNEFEGGVS